MTRIPSLVVAFLVLLSVTVRASPAMVGDASASGAQLPRNIRISRDLESVVARLLARSQTFRRQCTVIAASNVRVSVLVTVALRESTVRARATIGRSERGLLWALIEVPPVADYAELLPHELEHVIEQIEGLDLPVLARSGDPRVIAGPDGAFETPRARAAGLSAATEFYASTDPALTAAGRAARHVWRALSSRAGEPADWAARMRARRP